MILAFSYLGILFVSVIRATKNAKLGRLLDRDCNSDRSTRAVVVFHHYRDVKVALDELSSAGFSHDCLTLVSRRPQSYVGHADLITDSCFNREKFNFSQVAQEFFLRLFQKGKYLVSIEGSHYDIKAASKIMSRRRHHAQMWHFE